MLLSCTNHTNKTNFFTNTDLHGKHTEALFNEHGLTRKHTEAFFNEHGLTRKDTETLRGVNSPPWIRRGRGGLTHGILLFCTNHTNLTNGFMHGTHGNSFYTDDSFYTEVF